MIALVGVCATVLMVDKGRHPDCGVLPYETIFIGRSLSKGGLVPASRGIGKTHAHYGNQRAAEISTKLVIIAADSCRG